jgi:hypothetical protein
MSLALSNLVDASEKDEKTEFGNFLQTARLLDDVKPGEQNDKWNITDSDLKENLENTSEHKISFYFVLRWLNREIT